MRRFNTRLITLALAGFLSVSASLSAEIKPAEISLSQPVAGEITIEQLARVLPAHPVRVGFDVDDTLIFSAPAFNELEPKYDAAVIRPKDYASLTAEQKKQYHEFWNKLNEELDDRSIPRTIGKRLLELHTRRGDDIYIISKRQGTVPPTDTDTKRYEKMFGMQFKHKVIQTQLKDKAPFIAHAKLDYYYGDSDSDITSAVGAKATPIRVKRGKNSYAKDVPHNGQLDEIVLTNPDEQ